MNDFHVNPCFHAAWLLPDSFRTREHAAQPIFSIPARATHQVCATTPNHPVMRCHHVACTPKMSIQRNQPRSCAQQNLPVCSPKASGWLQQLDNIRTRPNTIQVHGIQGVVLGSTMHVRQKLLGPWTLEPLVGSDPFKRLPSVQSQRRKHASGLIVNNSPCFQMQQRT